MNDHKKQSLRKHLRDMLDTMEAEVTAGKSRLATEKLIRLPEFRAARVVMIYVSTDREVDTAGVAAAAWSAGKMVLVPKVNIADRHMIALECKSMHSGLVASGYGILEPTEGDAHPIESIDLIVVPGLAFDRDGNRLGQGAGFYDRFLSTPGMRATTAAVAFSEQVIDSVPTNGTDWPIDILVTDKEVVRFADS